jgi:hypothetical protein
VAQELDRYLVALPRGQRQIYLSWRLLKEDGPDAAFEVQRRRPGAPWERVSAAPVSASTDFVDTAPQAAVYEYRVIAGRQPSRPARVDTAAPPTNLAFEFPLQRPPQHFPLRLTVGDLENNGRYGVIILEAIDDRVHVCAYSLEGRLLWQIGTGLPAKGGWDGRMHHVPCAAWDVNRDGRTEVVFHKGPGVPFPDDFYAAAGPDEKLVAVDGETGETVWETPWPATRARVMLTIGTLRGANRPPSVVVLDGSYGDETITAIDGGSGRVQWRVQQTRPAGHNLDINDVDGDGCMEVVAGGTCYRGDGTVLWEAEPFGHTDVSKPARFLPELPGLQVLYLVEKHNPGVYLVDCGGKTLWRVPFGHAHWSWIGRYDVGGAQLMIHAAEKGERQYFPIFFPDGREWTQLTKHQAHRYAAVGWEADGMLAFAHRKDKRIVRLDNSGGEVPAPGSDLPQGSRFGRHQVCVDLIGDFRENFACIDYEKGTFYVAQNPQPAGRRALSPLEDPNYRHERSQLGSGYYTYIAPPQLDGL